jgi:hypothetical protein
LAILSNYETKQNFLQPITQKAELSKVKVKLRVMMERIELRQLLLDWKKSPDGQAVDTELFSLVSSNTLLALLHSKSDYY